MTGARMSVFNHRVCNLVILAVVSMFTLAPLAQERDRARVPDKYKWDLTHIYPSDEAWAQAKARLAAEIPKVASSKGRLGESAARLADALDLINGLSKELSRLFVYASMMSDTDTRVAKYQAMQQEMIQIGATFGAEAAYLEPEVLKIGRAHV